MRRKGKYEGWLTLGTFWVFVILPCMGYGASLTIGNTVSVNGNMNATSFSGDGSGLTNVGGDSDPSCTPITSLPSMITAPGVYCLTSDLATNVTSGNAIEITTDNVVINLNGHTIDGQTAGLGTTTYGIYAYQRQNITIRHGTVRGFLHGIYLKDDSPYTTSQGHIIEDIRADQNTRGGLSVQGRGNVIRNNVVVDTGGSTLLVGFAWGIIATGPGASVVSNNIRETIQQEGQNAYGVQISGGHGSVVADNIIGNANMITGTSCGIYVKTSSNVTVKGNIISNMNEGVHYESDGSGPYLNNVVSGSTTPYTGGTPTGLTNFGKTTTSLLFPFVSNLSGFDTVIAIANTSDPGSGAPSGTCTISFFSANAPPPLNTVVIQAGNTYANLLSYIAPGFEGYIIAKCNFPRARGWGFVSEIGVRNLAASITAEVLP